MVVLLGTTTRNVAIPARVVDDAVAVNNPRRADELWPAGCARTFDAVWQMQRSMGEGLSLAFWGVLWKEAIGEVEAREGT